MSLVEKLSSLCHQWRGELVLITQGQYDDLDRMGLDAFSPAPFTNGGLGVDWNNKIVYHVNRPWYELVHEMGHVFACLEPPNRAVEEYYFLGWEIALVKLIGGDLVQWTRANKDYVVSGDVELGSLPPEGVADIFDEVAKYAHERGLVVDGKPIAIR